MPVKEITATEAIAIAFTHTVDSVSDYSKVDNDTRFLNKRTDMIMYKNNNGVIVEVGQYNKSVSKHDFSTVESVKENNSIIFAIALG